MAKRNITVRVDEKVVELARAVAARYEQARAHALEAMAEATDRGGVSWLREDLYDR